MLNVKFEGIRMCEKMKYFLNSMTSWVIFATQTQCKGVDSSIFLFFSFFLKKNSLAKETVIEENKDIDSIRVHELMESL